MCVDIDVICRKRNVPAPHDCKFSIDCSSKGYC